MSMLVKIFIALCALDLLVFPFYMVRIIRKGVWLYDFQRIHALFHIVQLLFFVAVFWKLDSPSLLTRTVFAAYIAACLQHNFKLHQFLTPNAVFGSVLTYGRPFATRYFDMLKTEFGLVGHVFDNLTHSGVFLEADEFDGVCRAAGQGWGFVNYMNDYGIRFACDLLAIVSILALLA